MNKRQQKAFYSGIAENIAKHKRHIFMVIARNEEDGPGFVYTIGNQERGLPELLIIGVYADSLTTRCPTR